MFDFADKTFDQMPFTVPPFVVLTQDVGALMGWNHRFNASIQQIFDEVGCRVAPVGNQSLKLESLQQVLGLGNIVALPSGQAETQRVSQSIHRHMDLSGESTSAASESLLAVFFSAPAAQGWARTIVLSIMPCSMSGSSAN